MPRKARGWYLEQRRPSGIWYACCTQARRKFARSTGTRDQAEAEQWLKRFLDELARPPQPASPTVASVIDGYLHARSDARSIRVMRIHSDHVKRHLGTITITELRPHHAMGYATTRRSEGVSDGTIRQELVSLRAALRWSKRWLEEMRGVEVPFTPMPKPVAPKNRWLTPQEADKLLQGAVAHHVKLFIQIALGTGARSAAILNLRWLNVDMVGGVIDFGVGYGGKRNAVVPVHPKLLDALREAHQGAQTPWVIEFNGAPVTRITYGFQQAVRRSGIARCCPHDCRRTAGSWMLQRGISMVQVSRMLGHTSVRVTESVYAHHNVEFLREAANALGQ